MLDDSAVRYRRLVQVLSAGEVQFSVTIVMSVVNVQEYTVHVQSMRGVIFDKKRKNIPIGVLIGCLLRKP